MAGVPSVYTFYNGFIPQASTSSLTPVISPVCSMDVTGTVLPGDVSGSRGVTVELLARSRAGGYVEDVRVFKDDLEEAFRQTREEYRVLSKIEGRCRGLLCQICHEVTGRMGDRLRG